MIACIPVLPSVRINSAGMLSAPVALFLDSFRITVFTFLRILHIHPEYSNDGSMDLCYHDIHVILPHTRIWNGLPEDVVSAPTLSSFRRRLKPFLFQQSYPDIII